MGQAEGPPQSIDELNTRAATWLARRAGASSSRASHHRCPPPAERLVVESVRLLGALPRRRFDTAYVEPRRVHVAVPQIEWRGVHYSVTGPPCDVRPSPRPLEVCGGGRRTGPARSPCEGQRYTACLRPSPEVSGTGNRGMRRRAPVSDHPVEAPSPRPEQKLKLWRLKVFAESIGLTRTMTYACRTTADGSWPSSVLGTMRRDYKSWHAGWAPMATAGRSRSQSSDQTVGLSTSCSKRDIQ